MANRMAQAASSHEAVMMVKEKNCAQRERVNCNRADGQGCSSWIDMGPLPPWSP